MKVKEKVKKGLNRIKKILNEEKTIFHTEDLFYLIEEGLEQNKTNDNDMYYALCYEYVKGNEEKTFKAVDLLNDVDSNGNIDTTYYYLNVCHGKFDKGYLMSLCWNMDISPEIKLISEKENENGEIICREKITFSKERAKIRK